MMIWTYWEGNLPDYIAVCLDSMRRTLGDSFRLVTPDNLDEYISTDLIDPNWRKLDKIAMRVCCVRAAILSRHGGWWWDADTICLRSPRYLEEKFSWADGIYMVWTKDPLRALNGYVYLVKDLATEWLSRINFQLQNGFDKIIWCSLGEGILTPLLCRNPKAMRIQRRLFLPIDIDSDVKKFFQEGNPLSCIENDTVAFGLNHSYFDYWHGDLMGRERWSNSPLLIHRLLRWASS